VPLVDEIDAAVVEIEVNLELGEVTSKPSGSIQVRQTKGRMRMEMTNENTTSPDLEAHVAEIVSNYLAKNQVAASDLPALITTVYQSLQSLGKTPEPLTPAVPIRQSVTRDHVVCLRSGAFFAFFAPLCARA